MSKENISYAQVETIGTVVHVAVNKEYAGYIVISDEVKEDSAKAIKALKEIGVRKTVMLTGDNKVVGTKVAKQLGLDEVYSELLPDQKVEKVEALDKEKSSKGKLIFVGDGINDAPVLGAISQKKLPIKVSYVLAKNIAKIEDELKLYNKEKQKLIDMYSIKDEEGKPLIEDNNIRIAEEYIMDWNRDIKDLLDIENEIDIHKFQIDELVNSNCVMSPMELMLIDYMIEEQSLKPLIRRKEINNATII